MKPGQACWRCERGAVLPNLAGERSCVNCGAPAERPLAAATLPPLVRTNRPRWDRVAASAWPAA